MRLVLGGFVKKFYEWFRQDEADNYVRHLDREWDSLGWPKEGDDMQARIYRHLKKLLREFSDENHSGSSASYAVNLFKQAAMFKPLSPLTGEDSEWVEIGEGEYQNKRCSHVFKSDGRTYDSNGKVFVHPNGASYTSKDSRVDVVFPYTPKTEYVNVSA